MAEIEWTPWTMLSLACAGLLVLLYPFQVRSMLKEEPPVPGRAGQLVVQGGVVLMLLGSAWPGWVRDAVTVVGALVALAGVIMASRARRREAVA